MLLELSHHFLLPILFITGLTAGTVDAIAGGGGLISLPILLSVGIPPHLALGTNKFQSTFGTSIAAYSYYRHGIIDKQKILAGLIFTLLGALIGAISIQYLSGDILKRIIPSILLVVLIYTLFAPKKLSGSDLAPKLSEKTFYLIFGLALGFYDGFLGPGVGSFWVFAFMFFLDFSLVKATAYTKIFNLNTNIVALICFALTQHIDYRIGICMAAGQLIGGRLGAYLAIKKGAELIRPLFVLVVSGTIVTLIYKSYAGSRMVEHFNMATKIIFSLILLTTISMVYIWRTKKLNEVTS
ncbi:MAG: TSUP family transporter [Gammaproteobacteria bacterium]